MLNRYLLTFSETESCQAYRDDSQWFFIKTMPLITGLLYIGVLAFEIMARVSLQEGEEASARTTFVNIVTLILVTCLTMAIRRKVRHVCKLVCPLLTLFITYYMVFNDFTVPKDQIAAEQTDELSGELSVEQLQMTRESLSVNTVDNSVYLDFLMRSCFGLVACFYALVTLSQSFFLSSFVFAPMITLFFVKTCKALEGDIQMSQAVVLSLFTIFVYVSVAYQTERLSKHSFLWREHFDRSFKKWLKIFESFPEGVTMLNEDGSILYSNQSMRKILEHPDTERIKKEGQGPASLNTSNNTPIEDRQLSMMGFADRENHGRGDPSTSSDRSLFESVKIKKWQITQLTAPVVKSSATTSVMRFIEDNTPGATYEVQRPEVLKTDNNNNNTRPPSVLDKIDSNSQSPDPKSVAASASNMDAQSSYSKNQALQKSLFESQVGKFENNDTESRKFLSLNALQVRVAGRNEKLFVARDVTHTVWLKEMEQTKRQMIEFTQYMINMIDDQASSTLSILEQLKHLVGPQAIQAQMIKECMLEMRRTRYSVRDFQYVNDIFEGNFEEPIYRRLEVRSSLTEVVSAALTDVQKSQIEVRKEVHERVPQFIAVEENFFHEVMINLMQQVILTIAGSGHLTIRAHLSKISSSNLPVLQIDFKSTFECDKQMIQQIVSLALERDFRRILCSEVDVHFKIAKILCNQLGWGIKFDAFRDDQRYSLCIPLRNHPHQALEDLLAAAQATMDAGSAYGFKHLEDDQASMRLGKQTPVLVGGRQIGERIVVSQQSQRHNRQNQAQIERVENHGDRPQTVDPRYMARGIKTVIEESQEDNFEDDRPNTDTEQRSTRSGQRENKCNCAQILFLLPQPQDIEVFRKQLNMKCDEAFTEAQAVKKIQTSVDVRSADKCQCKRGYKFFIIDISDLDHRLALEHHLKSLQGAFKFMQANSNEVNELSIVVLGVPGNPQNPLEQLRKRCEDCGVKYVDKPSKVENLVKILLPSESNSTQKSNQ